MLYRIRDGVSVFQDNPEMLAIPEFANLNSSAGDRRMRFVMLVADRRSPLRTLPEKERREKAARIAGWPMEGNRLDKNGRDAVSGKSEAIELGIKKYREYQYDENQATLDTINAQIHEIKEYLQSDKSQAKDYGKALEQAAKLGERLPGLIEARQKLESILQISTEYKPELTTYSSADAPEEYFEGESTLNAIEIFNQQQQKKNDTNN